MRARGWAALLTTGIVIAIPVSAGAASDLLSTPDGSPLAFERLAPGMGRTSEVIISNPSDAPATIALQVRITEENEGGCVRQELELEGDRCDDTGELGDWLDVSISHDDRQVWSGAIKDLAEPQTLPGDLGAGDSWDLEIGIEMPIEAGNDTMTDRIVFDLVAHAATDTGDETDVLGAQGSAPGGSDAGSGAASAALVPIAVNAGLNVMGLDSLTKAEPTRLILFGVLGSVVLAAAWLVVAERRRKRRW